MNETIVTLKKGEGRAFKAGGLWIYDNEIESIHGTFKNGAVVTVQEQNVWMRLRLASMMWSRFARTATRPVSITSALGRIRINCINSFWITDNRICYLIL